MNFPTRFHTGVRNTTIPNPAALYSTPASGRWGTSRPGDAVTFEGLCSDYDFKLQTANFIKLQHVLQKFGTDFLYVAGAYYKGDVGYNHRFVATSADGSLVWNKYVARAAQSGQNHVFVAGMRIKTSIFLKLSESEQFALLRGRNTEIKFVFDAQKLRWMNENDTLWN